MTRRTTWAAILARVTRSNERLTAQVVRQGARIEALREELSAERAAHGRAEAQLAELRAKLRDAESALVRSFGEFVP